MPHRSTLPHIDAPPPGQKPAAPPDRKQIRAQRRLIREQLEVKRLQHETQLLEWLSWEWDGFGGSDLWDRVRPQSQTDADGSQWVPPSVQSDRRHGQNWPIWRTQVELDLLRNQARLLCASNSYAKGLLANLVNNVIGKGCTYEVAPKPKYTRDGTEAPPEVQAAVDQVQAVIDGFLRKNRWNGTIDPRGNSTLAGSREREVYRRVQRDGEAFLRFHCQADGTVLVRFIEPEQVREVQGHSPREGWSFGVRHQMEPFEDVETPVEYSVAWPDPSAPGGADAAAAGVGELVPAEQVLHLKGPDTDSTIARGTSPFLYDVIRALDRASKLQRNISIGAAIRAATAEIWQYDLATQAQLTSLASSLADTQVVNGQTGRTDNIERVRPGTIRRLPQGQKYVDRTGTEPTPGYTAGVQGDLRQASAAFCAPEYWTGDASNGNYSSLETASSPAVRAGDCEQEYYKAAFARVAWKAVEWAVECGLLLASALDQVDITVTAPAVLHRNELEKAQEDQIGVINGWKDRQTCARERGLDWDDVARKNREYAEATGGAGAGLPLPEDPVDEPPLTDGEDVPRPEAA